MPKVLEKLVSKLKKKGHDESSAYAIATSALQKRGKLKKDTRKLSKNSTHTIYKKKTKTVK